MTGRLIPYSLGQTWAADELTHLEGHEAIFSDINFSATGAKGPLTGHSVYALACVNGTGSALLPGEIASWKSTTVGTGVGAKNAVNTAGAGVVDPSLPAAGVANGLHFWLIVRGPTTVIHAGNDTIVQGNELVTAASGRVDLYDATSSDADEVLSRFGRAIATPADNAAGTKFRALVDFRRS
jgi:hypothetical protein